MIINNVVIKDVIINVAIVIKNVLILKYNSYKYNY